MMFLKCCLSFIILLSPLVALAQSIQPSIKTEADLIASLCKPEQTRQSREVLLKSHSDLVTVRLWNNLNAQAADAYYSASPEQSLAVYEVAIQVANQLNDPKLLATTYYNIGRTYSGLNNLTQAIEAYLHSQKEFDKAGLHRDLIYIFSDLSALYFNLEDYQKAKDYSEQSMKLAEKLRTTNTPAGAWPDEYGVAGALSILSELSLREGAHAQAVEYLQQSLALFQRLNAGSSTYDIYISDSYAALGRIYTEAGDYSQALLSLNKSLEMMKNVPDLNRAASLLNNLGFLYMEQEDYAQATSHFNRSLQIFQRQNNRREVARVLLNLGVIEQRQANYDQALEYFGKSLKDAEAITNKDVMIAAGEGIGVVSKAKGDYKKALETLNQSLRLAREINDPVRQAELMWRLAEVYHAMGDTAQAGALAENAAKIASDLRLPKLKYLATTTLGQSYKENKPEIAMQVLAQAIQMVESMRETVAGQEEQLQLFFENKVASYHALIGIFIKQNRPLDALLYAERAKGRVLLDVLREGRVDPAKVMTPAEREKARQLNSRVLEIRERIRKEQNRTPSDASLLNQLYTQLDTARLKYDSFQNAIYASHPNLKTRRGYTSSLSLESINNLTGDNKTAYLEYVVTTEQVFLLALTKKSAAASPELKAYTIKIKADDLRQKVNQFHRLISERNPVFASSSRELYDLLVKPAAQQLEGITTLCIIPDASLWDVPFQALLSEADRYLLEDYALYYAPSLSVLQEMSRQTGKETGRAKGTLIAFGNPVIGKVSSSNPQISNSDQDLCPLPEAETEVATLAQIYGSTNSKTFIGRDADEKRFKLLAPGFRTIHLATHGVLDNQHPLYSYLLLTKGDGDLENDGLLEAREIMNMKLHADLAVLSACETARGRVGAGEGVIGMSWAFFVAGVRTTVVSQWKVNSASTSQLMMNFYKELESDHAQAGVTKATALRAAAITLMKDSRYRHPFYWASFVIVGSNK